MSRKSAIRPRLNRNRQLNLIYFVDSARTRSLRLPLGTVHLLLGFGALVVVWAIGSIFILVKLEGERQQTKDELRTALTNLFDYQTRYDGVYELAYPDSTRSMGTVADAGSTKAALATPTPAAQPATPVAAAPKPAAALAKIPPTPAGSPAKVGEDTWDDSDGSTAIKAHPAGKEITLQFAAVPTPVPGVQVVVENPMVVAGEKSAEFFFDLRNLVASDKAEGFIWAIATFVEENGKKTFVGLPSGVRVGSDGLATNGDKGYRFAIMRFRRKSFVFQYPNNFSGKFSELRVVVKAHQSDATVEYQSPVAIDLDTRRTSKGALDEKKAGEQNLKKSGSRQSKSSFYRRVARK